MVRERPQLRALRHRHLAPDRHHPRRAGRPVRRAAPVPRPRTGPGPGTTPTRSSSTAARRATRRCCAPATGGSCAPPPPPSRPAATASSTSTAARGEPLRRGHEGRVPHSRAVGAVTRSTASTFTSMHVEACGSRRAGVASGARRRRPHRSRLPARPHRGRAGARRRSHGVGRARRAERAAERDDGERVGPATRPAPRAVRGRATTRPGTRDRRRWCGPGPAPPRRSRPASPTGARG